MATYDHALLSIKGEVLKVGSVKELSTFITIELDIPCKYQALYRALSMGYDAYGMKVVPSNKTKIALDKGFSEYNPVWKYFQQVPVKRYRNMKEACKANNIELEWLKSHMYDLKDMGNDNVYLPYKLTMTEFINEQETYSKFKGEIRDSKDRYLFRYRSAMDLELKLNCCITSVNNSSIAPEGSPLLNNGVYAWPDKKLFNELV